MCVCDKMGIGKEFMRAVVVLLAVDVGVKVVWSEMLMVVLVFMSQWQW